jgi:hypothetical protein
VEKTSGCKTQNQWEERLIDTLGHMNTKIHFHTKKAKPVTHYENMPAVYTTTDELLKTDQKKQPPGRKRS